jgi:Holliday junction resolvase-like predicted endonuclease
MMPFPTDPTKKKTKKNDRAVWSQALVVARLKSRQLQILETCSFWLRSEGLGLGEVDITAYEPQAKVLLLIEVKALDVLHYGIPVLSKAQRLRLHRSRIFLQNAYRKRLEVSETRLILALVHGPRKQPKVEFLENP